MNNPLVSIIIPAYNRGYLIEETLKTVLLQSYKNWECIVVDDGSNDNTLEICKNYAIKDQRFKFHERPSNLSKGANSCRNYGFELSKGELIQWFDSDDLMLPDYISEKVNCFSDEISMVMCPGFYWYPITGEKEPYDLVIKNYLFNDYVRWESKVLTPSVLFKRKCLSGEKKFNTKMTRGQEFEFFSRLFFNLKENDYYIVNKPLFLYRQHSNSISLKDNVYIKPNKESMVFIALNNLERSIKIKDIELIKYQVYRIVNYYIQSVENKHYKNVFYIFFKFSALLLKINFLFFIEFSFWGSSFFILRKRSYKIEKRIRNYKIE
ncbi:glycosyltransferase family 2 protein [Flavobacterium aquicola]|uniref:Glycosyltransferase involved in cell wall biosynthesis n=1 Tax=Flavobacterium aquicola TaxID=1682742 RepID=A0A3E0EJ18_9FLAO|nr:glycosyltransferase family 2 protein [Flavobacterium aquicola]REG98267.1 glycosyltransferase involved in cell wall biosynthesis [Flavobacterium aquicola]